MFGRSGTCSLSPPLGEEKATSTFKVDHRSMAATMRRPMRNATEISDGSHAPTTAAAVDGAALRAVVSTIRRASVVLRPSAGAHSRRTQIHGIACSGGHLARALLPTLVSYRGAAAHPVAAVSGRTGRARVVMGAGTDGSRAVLNSILPTMVCVSSGPAGVAVLGMNVS